VLQPIPDATIFEQTPFMFTATATDRMAILDVRLSNAPAGSAINSTNGVFTWMPDESQGPGTNNRGDCDGQRLAESERDAKFHGVVLESNRPPVLTTIDDSHDF